MTSRDSLHRLVDDLPETEISRAERLLEVLKETAEPLRYTLENAPEDDEAETPREAAAVTEAWRDHREGKSLSSLAQEAALERLLSQSHHLGGRVPSRDELHER